MKPNKIGLSETMRELLANKIMINEGYELMFYRFFLSVYIPLKFIGLILFKIFKLIIESLFGSSNNYRNKNSKYKQEIRRREINYQNRELVDMLYNR